MMQENGKQLLDRAFRELEQELPRRMARLVRWLRNPKSRRIRIPVGVLCILGSFLWFLPVLGLWLLPLGLLLIAQDIRWLQRPVGRFMLWSLDHWRRFRARHGKRSKTDAAQGDQEKHRA
jgi:cobalamin biosynthesis protein CobD/CbiB